MKSFKILCLALAVQFLLLFLGGAIFGYEDAHLPFKGEILTILSGALSVVYLVLFVLLQKRDKK